MPTTNPISIPAAQIKLTTTTIVLVRHADVTASNNADPSLNNAGQLRALELIHVLGQESFAAIYASEFQRTQQTIQPLAQQLGINVKIIGDAAALVSDIKAHHTGQRIVVAGHSNTLPQIITAFGGGQVPAIPATEFDRLFVMTVTRLSGTTLHVGPIAVTLPDRTTTTVVRLQYGSVSP